MKFKEGKILIDRDQAREVESEEKYIFVVSIIDQLGISLGDALPEEPHLFDAECKIELRKILHKFNVSIIDDMDGGLKIYVDKDLVADWKKPIFILKKDLSELQRSKRLYYEMITSYWSIFDQE